MLLGLTELVFPPPYLRKTGKTNKLHNMKPCRTFCFQVVCSLSCLSSSHSDCSNRSHIDNLSIYCFAILRHNCLHDFLSLLDNQNQYGPLCIKYITCDLYGDIFYHYFYFYFYKYLTRNHNQDILTLNYLFYYQKHAHQCDLI